MAAGADAATQMDAAFRAIIDNDPQIQAVIRSVWGNASRDERPSDTPKNLEARNAQASKQITEILRRKGIELPDRTFINPRSGTIEGHRGWSGLNGLQKAAIIAAAAAATGGTLAATGVIGGVAPTVGGATAATGGGGGAAAGGGGTLAALTAAAGSPQMIAPAMIPTLSASTLASAFPAAAGTAASVAPAAAAPSLWSRLGGAVSSKALGTIGSAASGYAQDLGNERTEGVNYNLLRDQLGLNSERDYNTALTDRGRLDLEQRKYGDTARQDAINETLRSSGIQSFKMPERPRGIPNISFTSGFNAQARQAADEMGRQAQQRLLTGTKFDDLPELQRYQLTSPEQMPKAGIMERIAGILGLGTTAASGLLDDDDGSAGVTPNYTTTRPTTSDTRRRR